MCTIRRVFAYILRKPVHTVILLLISVFLSTAILSLLSILRASNVATLSLHNAIINSFTLNTNYTTGEWRSESHTDESYAFVYGGEYASESMLERIAAVDGITGYSYRMLGYTTALKEEGSLLSLNIPENTIGDSGAHANTVYGLDDTNIDQYFMNGTLQLVEGRHIVQSDANVVLVSDKLAEINDLHLGDTILLDVDEVTQKASGYSIMQLPIEVSIVGIYSVISEQANPDSITKLTMIENLIFSDYSSIYSLYSWSNDYSITESVIFFVDDPRDLYEIMDNVHGIKEIDWNTFYLSINDDVYNTYASALTQLEGTVTILLIVGMISSIIVLVLMLILRTKSRTHEIGILMSLGVNHSNIVLQLLLEASVVILVAISMSYFASSAIAQSIGELIMPQVDTVSETASISTLTLLVMQTPTELDIDVVVYLSDLAIVTFAFVVFITVSTSITAFHINRLNPNVILSELS